MPRTSFADLMTGWEDLIATVDANQPDLASLSEFSAQLAVELAGAKEAHLRQATSQAVTQQATRDVEGFLTRGRDLADRLRTGIRSRYGRRAEKLTEFRLRPLRKRKTSSQEQPPAQQAEPEEEEKSAPPEAATDGKP